MVTQVNQTLIFRGTICSIVDVQPKKVTCTKWSTGELVEIKTADIKFDALLLCWRSKHGKIIAAK